MAIMAYLPGLFALVVLRSTQMKHHFLTKKVGALLLIWATVDLGAILFVFIRKRRVKLDLIHLGAFPAVLSIIERRRPHLE